MNLKVNDNGVRITGIVIFAFLGWLIYRMLKK